MLPPLTAAKLQPLKHEISSWWNFRHFRYNYSCRQEVTDIFLGGRSPKDVRHFWATRVHRLYKEVNNSYEVKQVSKSILDAWDERSAVEELWNGVLTSGRHVRVAQWVVL